jgi:hypothetical protein
MIKVDINLLNEHPLNQSIYGNEDPEQFNELVEKIRTSGWISPIVYCRRNYVILSGHRRVRAAKVLGRTEIEAEVYCGDEERELEILLAENAYREKTNTQKVREAEYYREIEEKKAEERRNFVGLLNIGQTSDREMVPQHESTGRTRDIVAEKIGMSGKSYDKARKVVEKIDKEYEDPFKFFLEDTLNENIDAASKLVDKTDDFIQTVMQKTNGDVKKVSSAISELEKEETKSKTHMPPGKYQVIYADLTNQHSESEIAQLQIGEIAESSSVLFLWVTPTGLERGLKLAQHWGFVYKTCMVWNKEFLHDVTNKAEILLISAKGNPAMIFKESEPYRNGNKPQVIHERIQATYLGAKLELLSDGWQIWG